MYDKNIDAETGKKCKRRHSVDNAAFLYTGKI